MMKPQEHSQEWLCHKERCAAGRPATVGGPYIC